MWAWGREMDLCEEVMARRKDEVVVGREDTAASIIDSRQADANGPKQEGVNCR
jgi:hypothetical protein